MSVGNPEGDVRRHCGSPLRQVASVSEGTSKISRWDGASTRPATNDRSSANASGAMEGSRACQIPWSGLRFVCHQFTIEAGQESTLAVGWITGTGRESKSDVGEIAGLASRPVFSIWVFLGVGSSRL